MPKESHAWLETGSCSGRLNGLAKKSTRFKRLSGFLLVGDEFLNGLFHLFFIEMFADKNGDVCICSSINRAVLIREVLVIPSISSSGLAIPVDSKG